MRKPLLTTFAFFLFGILLSQDKTIISDLENLTLDVGQVFTPTSKVVDSRGGNVDCIRIIYYNKKGVFSSAKSITFDRTNGTLKANDPGNHDVVAVCIDSNGKRLTRTFNISVNYPKIKKVKLSVAENKLYVGNYIPLVYEITDELDKKRIIDYWNYDKAYKYFSKVDVSLRSNNGKVKIDSSNNIYVSEYTGHVIRKINTSGIPFFGCFT